MRIDTGNGVKTVDIVGLGEILIHKDRPAKRISFSSFLPWGKFPGLNFDYWYNPYTIKAKLQSWKDAGRVYPIEGLTVSRIGDVFRYPVEADDDETVRSNLQEALAEPSENANVAQIKKWAEDFTMDGYNLVHSVVISLD